MKTSDPKIAVVIPVFKQSVLLTEALNAALSQQTEFPYRIVIVNDGCPFEETHQICQEYALAHPDKISYVRRTNGGLSAARNTGIEFALAKWPSIEAIYLLDADNRLLERALDQAFKLLLEDESVDWIYPNIDMFGETCNCDFAGPYSLLQHLDVNICEAGSMIRRSVFAAGLRFDERMKLGYEDWEFWLHAASRGFRGRNCPTMGFQYRKRPESMVAESTRNHNDILGYIKRKHRTLFEPRTVTALEHAEAPRYAIVEFRRNKVILTSDPTLQSRAMTLEEYERSFWRHVAMPSRHGIAPFVVFTRSDVLRALEACKLIRWVFWTLEDLLNGANIAFAVIENSGDEDLIEIEDRPTWNSRNVSIIMTTVEVIAQCVDDDIGSWLDSLRTTEPNPSVAGVRIRIPPHYLGSFAAFGNSTGNVVTLVDELRCSVFRAGTVKNSQWRSVTVPPISYMYNIGRSLAQAGPIYPRVAEPESKHAGFILPLVHFGGVEKVTFNVARVLRDAGWTPHLIVFASSRARISAEWHAIFDSISFLNDADVGHWNPSKPVWGTPRNPWMFNGAHGRALGLLAGLDLVMNCHSLEANALMGRLRTTGVVTGAMLHLFDIAPSGRPTGHVYLTLAYEHTYDLITSCSKRLADECHALGIPSTKIHPVLNCAGYVLEDGTRRAVLARRQQRVVLPLRVLVLGRLDRQKGLHRVAQVVRITKARDMLIEWRIVGSAVLRDEDPVDALQEFMDLVEPGSYDSAEVTRCYEWADVMLVLSEFEGLPLTIIEAMRLGVVVCATDVGAVSEILQDDENGYLLPLSNAVEACVARLKTLNDDREVLKRLSRNAAEIAAGRTWEQSCAQLMESLERLLNRNLAERRRLMNARDVRIQSMRSQAT